MNRYSLIYADPAWSYGNTISNGAAVIVNQMRALANVKRPHNAKPDWRKTD